VNSEIDYQKSRNQHLRTQIALLDQQVAEIRDLQRKRSQLIERMRVIQALQGNRPVIVRLLDQLVRTVPDGVFYTSLETKANVVTIEGVAESNNRVSSLMRRLDASDWLENPNLDAVQAAPRLWRSSDDLQADRRLAVARSGPGAVAMNFAEQLKALNEFDLSDLDMENIGSWPLALKVIVLALLYAAILVAGFYFHVDDLNKRLGAVEQEEQALRQDFEKKAFEAANLEAYKAQLVEMEQRFGALVAQLPSETEVPGLLEDITDKGELNGLSIKRIDLLSEQAQTFYIELPIAIEAVGVLPRSRRLYFGNGRAAQDCHAARLRDHAGC
jgi:type IV pilus assembly protein PilO